MVLSLLASLLGGLGLFLHGISLLTSGLKMAAGNSLRSILKKWTHPLYKGVLSGFSITALVQSSSAVTVAVIGFVNAGIMDLSRSIGVIYGANLGTTITGWLVTAIGYSVHIKSLALPLIGIGVFMRIIGKNSRKAHLGEALAGFGLFFLGIDLLQEGFGSLGQDLNLTALASGHFWTVPAFVGIGVLLTLIMQSSSGAIAVVLTAASSEMIGMQSAAAAVIGTNIGTTSTAMIAVIGATLNAKKVALGHLSFNVVSGVVALLLLPVLLYMVEYIQANLAFASGPAGTLALFNTVFNFLGLILIWPFTKRLVNFLDQTISPVEASSTKYLDQTLINTPNLALDALALELERIGRKLRGLLKDLLFEDQKQVSARTRQEASELIRACQGYALTIQQYDIPSQVGVKIPVALRVTQYFRSIEENIREIHEMQVLLPSSASKDIRERVETFMDECWYILKLAENPCAEDFEDAEDKLEHLTTVYHRLKETLLQAGAENRLDISQMVQLLDYYSLVHKTMERTLKSTVYWLELRSKEDACPTG
ncbi:MAG: Na/Pi cotransporter family protein [Desulfonatronovibrionaceae bacterium]